MVDIIRLGLSEQTGGNRGTEHSPIRNFLGTVRIEGNGFSSLMIPVGNSMRLPKLYAENKVRILIFFSGKCCLHFNGSQVINEEVAVFVQDQKDEVLICAEGRDLQVLELTMLMDKEDQEELQSTHKLVNTLFRYSESPAYTEDIKSAKTVSRTLLPEGIVPRLSIGSVYTEGEDLVAPHKHPMLEQCFLGLGENNSVLVIEERQFLFPALSLVHIPLGKMHGVVVEKGKTMHYLWIDMFHTLESMRYLKEQHVSIGQNND